MYAIFVTGGKQYKVAAGDVIRVEKLPEVVGDKIAFDKVLAVNDGKSTQVGTPYLDAATVDTTVTAVGKGDKVIVYKFKAKKDYRRKQGHRQPFTEIRIESVSVGGKTIFKAEAVQETVKKEKPAKEDAGKTEEAKKDSTKSEAKDAADDVKSEDKPIEDAADATEVATDESAEEVSSENAKLKKTDIIAKLEEKGIEYSKSAKKNELLALLEEDK